MVKLMATEMAVEVTGDGLQIHGGSGYTTERQVERHWRDARLTTIFRGHQRDPTQDDLRPATPPLPARLSAASRCRAVVQTATTSTSLPVPARSPALRVYSRAEWAWAVAAIRRSVVRARGCRPAATTAAASRP